MALTAVEKQTKPITQQEAHDLAMEAFTYFYPLVTMEISRQQMTNLEPGKRPGFGPMNAFAHVRQYPPADFKAVVRPNFDTLYSSAWIDLTEEPIILSLTDTAGRYYLMPLLDMWTDVFAVPGWRTSGTGEQRYALVAPGWTGKLPADTTRIDAPTPYVWAIGRTKTDGPDDYAAVHKIQDGFTLTPLSQWGKQPYTPTSKIDSKVDMVTPPLDQVNALSAEKYFSLAAELLKLHAPHATDWSTLARIERIGIKVGQSFDIKELDSNVQTALQTGIDAALKQQYDLLKNMGRKANGWQMNTDTMGVYGNYYLKRAVVAMVGLGANQPEDAVYPLNYADADGKPLMGENNYVLHFSKDSMPPAEAFWSITMYDKDGFQSANVLNRFAISSWMPLVKNGDGSIDIYLQHETPGKDKEANWLPAPKGELGVTMRLYAPKPACLNGDWNPPAIKRV